MRKILITKKTGQTRYYYPPEDWRVPLPKIQEIINDPNEYIDLIQHIALNHQGLNWKFFRYALSKDTYPVFLYAFAWCIGIGFKPTVSYSWQFQKNARKLNKFLKKNNIVLNNQEKFLIETCIDFLNWKDYDANRKDFINSIIDGLNNYYRNFGNS